MVIILFILWQTPHSLCSPTHRQYYQHLDPSNFILFQCCALCKKFVKYKSIFTSHKFGCRFLIFRLMDGSYIVGQDRKKEHLKDMSAQVFSHPIHGNLIFTSIQVHLHVHEQKCTNKCIQSRIGQLPTDKLSKRSLGLSSTRLYSPSQVKNPLCWMVISLTNPSEMHSEQSHCNTAVQTSIKACKL